MQIQTGSCFVTLGSATVVASAYNDWSQAQYALQYGTPVFFSLLGVSQVPIQVLAVATPATSASGKWEVTLVQPWAQPTTTNPNGDGYILHKDFTPNLALALPSGGDRQWAPLEARNFQIIDANYPALFATQPGATGVVYVRPGQTLYVADELDIPVGVEYDVLPGGAVEMG